MNRRPGEGEMRPVRLTCRELPDDPSGARILVVLSPAEGANSGAAFSRLSMSLVNDFKNALATIGYALDLSLKHKLPEKPASFLMTATDAVERGQQLSERMQQLVEGKTDPGDEETRNGASLRPAEASPEFGNGETVFVVEDEAALLLMLQEQLEGLGYRVISATSGTAALQLIEQGVEFDLVITDIVMPGGINGFDLAARIKELRHGAAVLYMSGYSGFDKADMGPVKAEVLKKPAPPVELARSVRTALAGRLH